MHRTGRVNINILEHKKFMGQKQNCERLEKILEHQYNPKIRCNEDKT